MATYIPQKDDDSQFVTATDRVVPIGALFDDVSPDTVDEQDVGIPRMDGSRRMLVRVVGSTDANRMVIDSSGRVGLAANSGTDVGDVDVTSVIPLTGVTNLGKQADAAASANSVGVLALGMRNDTPTTLVDANGDWSPMSLDSVGRMLVFEKATVVDNAGFTDGTSSVGLAGYILDEVAGAALTENDAAAARIDSKRAQVMVVEDATTRGQRQAISAAGAAAANLAQVAGNTVASGAGAVTSGTQRMTLASDDPAVASLAAVSATVYTDDTSTHSTGVSKGTLFMAAATPSDASVNANDIGAVAMTTDRKMHVSVQDALPAGTNAIGKLAANSGVDIGDVDVTSVIPGTGATNLGKAIDSAVGATDTGVGALFKRVDAPTAAITPAANDWAPGQVDASGRLWVNTQAGGRFFLAGSAPASATASTASIQIVASNASRKGLILTNVGVYNISLGIGQTAVINAGITLPPYGVFYMDEWTFSSAAINAIAASASGTIGIQEMTG